jgi:fructokinase
MTIAVMGETLCDLFASAAGTSLQDSEVFVPHLGGAPANVAVQLARGGIATKLLSAVGHDPLGDRLVRQLRHEGVDVTTVSRKPQRTGLTLVELDGNGERRFFGWRQQAADEAITTDDVQRAMEHIGSPQLGHVGTVTLRSAGVAAATMLFVNLVRSRGGLISVDINLRPGMWPDAITMLTQTNMLVAHADIVKASDEEARQLFGFGDDADADALADALLAMGPSMVMITQGAQGATIATQRQRLQQPAPTVVTIDATGAGDAFVAGALSAWSSSTETSLADASPSLLLAMVTTGNAWGAACTTAMGATTAQWSTI